MSRIGIELVNPGHEWGYRPFPDAQMAALVELAQGIVARWSIPAGRIVAPQRHRADPQGGSGRAVRLAMPGPGRHRLVASPKPARCRRSLCERGCAGRDRLPRRGAGRPAGGRTACVPAALPPGPLRRLPGRHDHGPVGGGSRLVPWRAGSYLERGVRRPDGRSRPRGGRGKSGLHGNTVPGNARRGRPQGKCHREQTARRGRLRVVPAGKGERVR